MGYMACTPAKFWGKFQGSAFELLPKNAAVAWLIT